MCINVCIYIHKYTYVYIFFNIKHILVYVALVVAFQQMDIWTFLLKQAGRMLQFGKRLSRLVAKREVCR